MGVPLYAWLVAVGTLSHAKELKKAYKAAIEPCALLHSMLARSPPVSQHTWCLIFQLLNTEEEQGSTGHADSQP